MITENELKISNESYTNKDFYTIYPEILEIVKKITSIYDPMSSNESDPGVAFLKILAYIADKNNYNIDKQILEIFMSSCTQQDSMRKLCDTLGYDMHYYQSAECNVSFMWSGSDLSKFGELSTKYILIPAYTALTNDAGDVNFVTTEDVKLTYRYETKTVPCIEGTYVDFTINSDNIVKINNIDENKRLYLSETKIAQNGVWVRDAITGELWNPVKNLNIQNSNQKVWKFCYDSKRKLPYIQFPEDVAEIITNGLTISYVRTSGENGNIAAKVLNRLSAQTTVELVKNDLSTEDVNITDDDGTYLTVQNASATLNGSGIETLDDAFNSFKKTVGTFDTLVTCRDYANAIYNMVVSDLDTSNLVSNVQVSDIRSDINNVNKVASFTDFGIVYQDIPETDATVVDILPAASATELNKIYLLTTDNKYYKCVKTSATYVWAEISGDEAYKMTHFDLFLYPLNPIHTSFKSETYQKTFKPNTEDWYEIEAQLNDYKTIAHKIRHIDVTKGSKDFYAIKNYYPISGVIATTYKVSKYEGEQILENIYTALYKKFNARNVDFGEELPYDDILSCIEKADTRIKAASLDDPSVYTKIMYGDGEEFNLACDTNKSTFDFTRNGHTAFLKLAIKNVLGGRIPLFDYDNRMNYTFQQQEATRTSPTFGADLSKLWGAEQTYPVNKTQGQETKRPTASDVVANENLSITHISSEVIIPKDVYCLLDGTNPDFYKLRENECVQLLAPNLKSTTVYPSYVNYYFVSKDDTTPHPCSFNSEETNYDQNLTAPEAFTSWRSQHEIKGYYLYKKSSNPDYSLNQGYLVDSDYYKYTKVTEFDQTYVTAGGKYFAAVVSGEEQTNKAEILGYEATIPYIPADSDYQLQGPAQGQPGEGDVLYINYTDSDDVVHDIKYTHNQIWENGVLKDNNAKPVIIKPNFDLYDSAGWRIKGSGHSLAKTSGSIFIDSVNQIPGMFSLGTTDQIDMRAFVKTKLNSPTNCYWVTENNKIKFTNGEYILNDGDYFFYTDENKVSLVTLGSGTRLTLMNGSTPVSEEWTLNDESSLDIDDVASNGIGAFADVTWQYRKDLSDTKYLEIAEMQIVSLSEGDTFRYNGTDIANNEITAEWKSLPQPENFTYNGKTLKNSNVTGLAWKIRSVLNINFGAELTQRLSSWPNNFETDSLNKKYKDVWGTKNKLTQSFKLYRTAWYYNDENGQPVYGNPHKDASGNPTEVFKVFKNADLLVTDNNNQSCATVFNSAYVTDNKLDLRCNRLYQRSGGLLLSIRSYTTDNVEVDNTYIYPFVKNNAFAHIYNGTAWTDRQDISGIINSYDDNFTKVSFENYQGIKLPIFIPDNSFALVMIYYAKGDASKHAYVKTFDPTVTPAVTSGPKCLSLYKNRSWKSSASVTYTDSLELQEGVNVIQIAKKALVVSEQTFGGFIFIDGSVDKKNIITIANVNIAKSLNTSGYPDSGIDYKTLGIAQTQRDLFLDTLLIMPCSNNFYFNVPIDNNIKLDIDSLSNPLCWFNYNNIVNHFVIGELDTNFKLKIADSSKVSKW